GVEITGKIDRVDRHKASGAFRILDYKTWDKKKSSKEVFLTTGAAAIAAAEALNLPLVTVSRSKGVWSDLQLPLYRLAFKTGVIPGLPSSAAAAEPECLHLTIARSETGTGLADDYDQRAFASDAAAQTISAVLARLRAGIFWPPLELPEDFAPLFPGVSEKEIKTGISQTWLDDQHRRLKTLPRNPEATP
ncbi:MAG: PD-(D/E)XK nuclease family protein, partial [Opitutaceae bacterium]|nr:PD-(D/E)XK nuclease family protein [Opitutaceae bacterium]